MPRIAALPSSSRQIDKGNKKLYKKANHVPILIAKVTEVELEQFREEERVRIQWTVEETKKQQSMAVGEEYERMVLVSNINREDSVIVTDSVEEAIVRMAVVGASWLSDRYSERRTNVSFKHSSVDKNWEDKLSSSVDSGESKEGGLKKKVDL